MALTKIQGSGISGGVNLKAINGAYTGGLLIEDDSNTTKSAITHVVGTMAISANASADHMLITADGEVTMPAQPAFMAGPSGTQSNMANDTTILLGTEVFDVGANFASNTFNAPVTGKYQLNASIRLQSVDSASNYIYLVIDTSNRDYYSVIDPDFGQDAVYWNLSVSVIADMDASDTAIMKFGYDGGAQQVDTSASGGTLFSGALIC